MKQMSAKQPAAQAAPSPDKKTPRSLRDSVLRVINKLPQVNFSIKPIQRSLHSFGSHWAIVVLAITVVLSGLAPRSITLAVGGQDGRNQIRYHTIAEQASTEFNNEDVVYDDIIITVGDNSEYIFKTGSTETIISRSNRTQAIEYAVKEGESLNSIASDFGLTTSTVKYANNLSSNVVSVGQTLTIPPTDGIYVTVRTNDTLSSLASRYKVSVDHIVKYNSLNVADPIFSGQKLLIPGIVASASSGSSSSYIPSGDSTGLPAFNPAASGGQFAWPTSSPTHYLSQGYWYAHKAIDLNRLNGWGIYASASGIVRTYTSNWGYGNRIDINHGDGWVTRYAHLSQFKVQPGDYVEAGQLIGIMGSTGRSTGPHLHFEIRYNGSPLNPLSYLPQ